MEVVHTLPVKTEIPTAAAAVVAKQQDGSLHVAADQGTAENITTKYMLTREMALKAATAPDGSKGAVVVTWANFHYKDFVMNWIEHLQATGCKTYLVGAMDDQLLQELIKANVPAFSMSSGLTLGDFGWGSPTFNKMGREKINLIQTFVKWEVDVIISDVDTVWLQDPVAYMKKVRTAVQCLCIFCFLFTERCKTLMRVLFLNSTTVPRSRYFMLIRSFIGHGNRWGVGKCGSCALGSQYWNYDVQTQSRPLGG